MAISYTPQKTGSSYRVTVAAPIDVRTVVDSVEDLTNNSISYMYTGLIVNVKGTGDLYILTTHPRLANNIGSWKKVGADIDLSGYVTSETFEERISSIVIPENVSAFTNDAGYLTENTLPDFLTASDIEDFISVEQLNGVLANYVSQSDLDVYVKTNDVIDYVEQNGDFVKRVEIKNFVEASDLTEYVRVDSLDEILTEKGLDDFVSQSDLTVYVKTEDLVDFVTSSELAAHIEAIDIPEVPTIVSAFTNDVGYLTENDLPDFLLASDLDGYVKTIDLEAYIPKTELEKLATKSDLKDYVKAEDAIEYLTSSDLDGYLKVSELPTNVSAFRNDVGYLTETDLPDFLTASDVEDFIRVDELNGVLADYVSQSDLDVYVKTKDVIDYIEQNGDFVKSDEIKNFLEASDVADFITVDQVNEILTEKGIDDFVSQSDLTVYVNRSELVNYVTSSELDNYVTLESIPKQGVFPVDSDVDTELAVTDGYATVQDVMDYVNALIEKKKEDELVYAYITGYALDGTPTDITVFNPFSLNKSGSTEIEVYASSELSVWDPQTYEDLSCVKFTVDIPDGYVLTAAYIWNDELGAGGEYELLNDNRHFDVNARYSTRIIDGVTYNSYSRGPVSDVTAHNNEKYKIIITKQ